MSDQTSSPPDEKYEKFLMAMRGIASELKVRGDIELTLARSVCDLRASVDKLTETCKDVVDLLSIVVDAAVEASEADDDTEVMAEFIRAIKTIIRDASRPDEQ